MVNKYPERDMDVIRIRPGATNYNQAVKDGKKTVVFSTSITEGINVKHFNVNYRKGTAKFVHFHAATASLIKHYVTPTLKTDQPETVIIMEVMIFLHPVRILHQ